MGQKSASYDAAGAIIGFYDDVDSPAPSHATVLEISADDWQACLTTPGYTVRGGALVPPAAPSAAALLAGAQARQLLILSTACQTAIVSGFTSSSLGSPYSYPSKATDQQNLGSSVLASLMPGLADDWTTPFWCADVSGEWEMRPHTGNQIQQVGSDGKNAILTLITKNADLAAQVVTAQTVAAVDAISWD